MGRGSTRRGISTRERLLDEASSLFIDMGYTKAPLSEISARLGITKAALYYYFESKDDLLLALVSPFFDQVDLLLSSMQARGVTDAREFLLAYTDVLRSDVRAVDIIGKDFNVSSHPDIAPRINAHVGAIIDILAGPGADEMQMARASAAMTVVQRGLFVHPGEPVQLRSMPPAERLDVVLSIAAGILES